MNIVDAVERHRRERPEAIAVTFLADGGRAEHSLTFAEIDGRSRAIADELRKSAPDAERVLVLQAPGLDFVVSLYACFIAGMAAVPAPPPAARASSNSAQRFARLLADAAPDVILTHSDLLARSRWLVEDQIGRSPQIWVASDMGASPPGGDERHAVDPGDLALIQYTSGSTAAPKGVLIDHANLAANLAAIQAKFALARDSVVVSWLPPYHDMGLIGGILESLWCGCRVVLMESKHFVARPLGWLEAIDRFRADVSGGPNFAYDLCVDALAHAEGADFDLSRWRLAFSGAEPVRATTIDRFARAFAGSGFRRSAFYPCYGLAEATLMATGPDPGAARPIITHFDGEAGGGGMAVPVAPGSGAGRTRALVSCGTPCAESSVEIIDVETGQPLAEGREGEIRITGPAVSSGYWRDTIDRDTATGEAATHRRPASLATGDLGFLWEGELYVTGRRKDLVIIRGRNVAPSDVEDAVALCHPALAPASSAAFSVDAEKGEELVVAAEVRREYRRHADWPDVFGAMRHRIAEQSNLAPVDIVLLRPGTLARTTSGKIRRQACRHAYIDGAWEPLARLADMLDAEGGGASDSALRMAAASREERLASLADYLVWRLAQLTSTPAAFITPDAAVDMIGLDSLNQVEFALHVERDLGVTLPVDWPECAPTLSSLARLIELAGEPSSDTESAADTPITPAEDETVPMTPRQADFLSGNPARPELFAEVLYFRTPRALNVDAVQTALAELAERHDAFSLRFRRDDAGWRSCTEAAGRGACFERIDISGLAKHQLAGVRAEVLKRIGNSLSLDTGPLVSAVLMDRGPDERGVLAVGFHHLVIDAVSLSVWVIQFQEAYENAACSRPAPRGRQRNRFIPWLRALQAYGQSDELATELDYWRDMCGVAGRSPLLPPSDGLPAWRSTGKMTLLPEENRCLLDRLRTPLARNAAVLSALSRACRDATGDLAPLVMQESHGRHPFPGTDPSTAVGWFVTRYPMGVPACPEISATELVEDVMARLSGVPKFGIGYGLLRRRPHGDPLREEMMRLCKPTILLQYRGNVDEAFRSDTVLPVIGVHHVSRAFNESCRNLGDVQPLSVVAGLSDGVLYWSVFSTFPVPEDMARATADGMRRFLVELASS
ncbi:AMP-binding protein [Oceanibaculum nanhaiense]|uniref:AMP-binding protein n=1 Tax=Oceanibaculum nanhaiense TaxID=1909734 RepID=UPI00396EB160